MKFWREKIKRGIHRERWAFIRGHGLTRAQRSRIRRMGFDYDPRRDRWEKFVEKAENN